MASHDDVRAECGSMTAQINDLDVKCRNMASEDDLRAKCGKMRLDCPNAKMWKRDLCIAIWNCLNEPQLRTLAGASFLSEDDKKIVLQYQPRNSEFKARHHTAMLDVFVHFGGTIRSQEEIQQEKKRGKKRRKENKKGTRKRRKIEQLQEQQQPQQQQHQRQQQLQLHSSPRGSRVSILELLLLLLPGRRQHTD